MQAECTVGSMELGGLCSELAMVEEIVMDVQYSKIDTEIN